MNDDLIKREQLSALADGEASAPHMQDALAYAESDDGLQAWGMYHLIGDVLRSPELAHHSQHDVLSGVRACLAQEEAGQRHTSADLLGSLATGELEQIAAVPSQQSLGNGGKVVNFPVRGAANASVFRWKMAAGFASVAAVAAIGWSVMLGGGAGLDHAAPAGAQFAALNPVAGSVASSLAPDVASASAGDEADLQLGDQAQSSTVVAVAGPNGQSVMLRDPRLDELLASQSQYSSAANLQMPASFLRNANFASTNSAQRH